VARVATSGRSGIPHVVPVCHVLAGGRLYFASGEDGRKVKNLQENPWATVTMDVYSDHWGTIRGVMIMSNMPPATSGSSFSESSLCAHSATKPRFWSSAQTVR